MSPQAPADGDIRRQVQAALTEDIGSGDLSAELLPAGLNLHARVICREAGVLCGQRWFELAFALLDKDVQISWQHQDGDPLMPDDVVCTLHGNARSMLTSERTALNFLQCLSGTATQAQSYAKAVADLDVLLLDTRKTLPGLRAAQKYAVTCGGCSNHRMGLFDAIMLKENHLAGDSIAHLVNRARASHPDVPVIVEVENLQQLEQACQAAADRALLDNFSLDDMRTAASRYGNRIRLEASGNVDLASLRDIAETGVHCISIGAMTKHVQALDFSLRHTSTTSSRT
ncbi:MAG: carboxylating nicotinate-nucleotide diphosphorylase [Gammaproteobacteria bacterium]|nr:carboxylating nicotinate-nucleotide diphosphorylase [Gammaproteobacteria bacterium]